MLWSLKLVDSQLSMCLAVETRPRCKCKRSMYIGNHTIVCNDSNEGHTGTCSNTLILRVRSKDGMRPKVEIFQMKMRIQNRIYIQSKSATYKFSKELMYANVCTFY